MRARFFKWACVGWLALLAAPTVYPAIIEVTNTNDSGFGSLRDAIHFYDRDPGAVVQAADNRGIAAGQYFDA